MTMYSVSMIGDISTHKCERTPAAHNYYDECFQGSGMTSSPDMSKWR